MTRISATIQPKELSDQMLIAEHREIIRIPNTIMSGKAKIENIPLSFKLGAGHVKFFYNKLKYLHNRYCALHNECLKRGFNVQNYDECFVNVPKQLYNDWKEPIEARALLVERINIRLKGMKTIRYYGIKKEYNEIKLQ